MHRSWHSASSTRSEEAFPFCQRGAHEDSKRYVQRTRQDARAGNRPLQSGLSPFACKLTLHLFSSRLLFSCLFTHVYSLATPLDVAFVILIGPSRCLMSTLSRIPSIDVISELNMCDFMLDKACLQMYSYSIHLRTSL